MGQVGVFDAGLNVPDVRMISLGRLLRYDAAKQHFLVVGHVLEVIVAVVAIVVGLLFLSSGKE